MLVSEVHRGTGAECDICALVTLANGDPVPSTHVLTALYGSTQCSQCHLRVRALLTVISGRPQAQKRQVTWAARGRARI